MKQLKMFNFKQVIDIRGGYNRILFTQEVVVSMCSVDYLQMHDIHIYYCID